MLRSHILKNIWNSWICQKQACKWIRNGYYYHHRFWYRKIMKASCIVLVFFQVLCNLSCFCFTKLWNVIFKKGRVSLANYTVSAEIQCENLQKEPCEFIVCPKLSLKRLWNCKCGTNFCAGFLPSSQLLKFIYGRHQVNQCFLFRYLKNARMTQRQPCIFLFESTTWLSQNKENYQIFSSCSVFARRRQSNMNFSGFEKDKNILSRFSVSK